jgi:hypothetical protein
MALGNTKRIAPIIVDTIFRPRVLKKITLPVQPKTTKTNKAI